MLLSDKYPFLTDYFTKALSSTDRPLPQSILFYGNDFNAQFTLSKEIARLLNCQKNKEDDCDCLNCKWIRDEAHPAVMVISRLDNKKENDDSKTVISIAQSNFIKETLMTTSEFHRVFIFCDRDDDGNIAGLNHKNFQAATANSLLKIIEEPQPRTTFIFLTRYIDDLLSTIISRSQCFFVPEKVSKEYNYELINSVFGRFWEFNRKDAFDISQNLQNLAKEHSVPLVLEQIQNYILSTLKTNPRQKEFINYIKVVESCQQQAKLGIKSTDIFDYLCLNLIK